MMMTPDGPFCPVDDCANIVTNVGEICAMCEEAFEEAELYGDTDDETK